MFDSFFELLFKYPSWVFAQGDVRLGSSRAAVAVVFGVAACAVAALWTYGRARRARPVDRAVLVGLRLLALATLVAILVRPVLAVRAAVPQQNVVGVLLDDSQSMRIADSGGDQTRGSVIQREFGTPDSPLLEALSSRYLVRLFRFSSSAQRVDSAGSMEFAGTRTRLREALQRAQEELAGLPLSAMVVLTDGADTTGDTLAQALLELKTGAVPVFTVGLGREVIERDIQLGRVTTPRAVLEGTTLVADIAVTHRGYRGETLPVEVESDGRILASENVTLPADGEPITVRVRFTADEAGAHVFRFRVAPQAGEVSAANNVREALIRVEDRREKILYVEGEPRFEVKFARMAVDADENLQLVVLQRTAENKYYRLDVDSAQELSAGFPRTREELFAYRGLILGSIEASAFTGDQLRMLEEFVERRGGGLLALGGRHALAEGGYAGTPVADALPVSIDRGPRPDSLPPVSVTIGPTRAGVMHAITQLPVAGGGSNIAWPSLPPLTMVNAIGEAKPAATVLLAGTTESGGEEIVLAHHRYGRGTAVAFPVQDSWLWQLHADVAVEDMTHETVWRQLLRWLVAEVPDPVAVTTTPERVERGETVTIQASVADAAFLQVNAAQVTATVAAPSGAETEVPLYWTAERDGEYRATFAPAEDGAHDVRLRAGRQEDLLGTAVASFRVAPGEDEAFDAAMRAPLLRRLAEETGGRFYTEDTMNRLPEDLKFTERGVTTLEEYDLWDMPALLLLLVGSVLAEWSYRRVRGLP